MTCERGFEVLKECEFMGEKKRRYHYIYGNKYIYIIYIIKIEVPFGTVWKLNENCLETKISD